MARSPGQWWIDTNYPTNMLQCPGIMTVDQQYQIEFNDLLSCVYQVIQYDGLPDTVDPTYFKMCLYLGGRVAVFRDTRGDGAIRALDCAMAGRPDIYYMPSQIMIVNPTFAGYSYQLTPGDDVAVIYCREVDRYQYGRETGGLYGLISTTSQLLADNTCSINVATKNMRLTNILSANDTMTKKSIDIVIKRMYDGSPYECVQSSLVDQLNSLPMTQQTNTQQLLQLIQTRQYILSHFYEQIGLKTHDQIKKERLITSEIDEGTELAVFNIQDMIAEIQRGIDDANRIFGLSITMRLHPLIAGTLEDAAQTDPDAADTGQTDDAADTGQTDDAADTGQTDDAAGDAQTEDAAGDAQTEDAAGDAQTEDAAGDAQTEDAAGDAQTDIQIDISGDVDGDVSITIDAAAEVSEPEDDTGGGETDGD